jgi:hypothetical protein
MPPSSLPSKVMMISGHRRRDKDALVASLYLMDRPHVTVKGNPPMKLIGQRIVILGGSSGIGLATAQAAAQEGASVVIESKGSGGPCAPHIAG